MQTMTDACSDDAPPPLLVVLLRALPDVSESALVHCESTIPRLADRPESLRFRCLQATRRILALRLDLAADRERAATQAEESEVIAAISAAAGPDVDLDLQLRTVRTVVAHVVGRYWEMYGASHTAALLDFTAATDRFHHRLEQLIVDAYCRRFGPAALERERQRLRAEALLSGDRSDDGSERPGGYLVLVVESRADLDGLPAGAAHTDRDGTGIVVVPAVHGTAAVEAVSRHVAGNGRGAASAAAASAEDVPAAYVAARELLALRPLLARPPAVLTAGDALPETLLGSDPVTAAALAAVIQPLHGRPGLVETLAMFLDCDLDRTATASRLHIHRRTLTQRLDRIGALIGHEPRTSRGVLVLGLALAAHRTHETVAPG
jgi:plasmid stabilization system protein ParE